MSDFFVQGLVAVSLVIGIKEWCFKKQEKFFIIICGILPSALIHSPIYLPVPIAMMIAAGLALFAFLSAWIRDRTYAFKLLRFALPILVVYSVLIVFYLY